MIRNTMLAYYQYVWLALQVLWPDSWFYSHAWVFFTFSKKTIGVVLSF